MFAAAVKIAPPVRARKVWTKPVAVNDRLGFEVSAYAGNNWVIKPSVAIDLQVKQWVKPVAINERLGFEVTAYAGSK
jgi:coenzyme PQQ precursor peptide PqqA